MTRFGTLPKEVPAQRTSAGSAPAFVAAVGEMLATLAGDLPETPFEWLRTAERHAYLYGFGRDYDDGRGKVTNAKTALFSHHGFGMGVDIVEKDGTPWDAPPSFWQAIGDAADATGLLKWGGTWHRPDLPHVYWSAMPDSLALADDDRALFAAEGIAAVWAKYGANA